MILSFNRTQETDEGTYRCVAVNMQGTDFREGFLKFKGSLRSSKHSWFEFKHCFVSVKPVSVVIYYYITGAIALLLLLAVIYIFIRMRKERVSWLNCYWDFSI